MSSPVWRKSSYSGVQHGECVEVASLDGAGLGIRDSKNPAGPHLTISAAAFRGLIGQIKSR